MRDAGRTVLAVAALVAGLATAAGAEEPHGPAFGSNSYTTEIRSPDAEPDTDDYVAPLLEGETLSVSVKTAKGATLLPTIVVLDPSGADRTPQLKVKGGGRKVGLAKPLVVDSTGPWTVRVAGDAGTEGGYTVSFKIGKAKPTTLKKQVTSGGRASHGFGCLEGALATIQIKYAKSAAPLAVSAVRDAQGDDAVSGSVFAASRFVAKGTKLTMKKEPIGLGDGVYALDLSSAGGEATYTLKISIAPQARPGGKSVLPAAEPRLDAVTSPLRGVAGRPIELTGTSLGTPAQKPVVLFDGVPGNVVSVVADGTSLSVLPPSGAGGATVGVTVIDPFGQASHRDDHFTYVPAPVLLRLESPAGALVTGGPAEGGDQVRLIGSGFDQDQVLRLGGQLVGTPVLVSATEWSFVTPARPAGGGVTLALTDAFGRQVVSQFFFQYKRPPVIGSTPATAYTPTRGAERGGTVVTVLGSDFDSLDRIEFDGTTIASSIVSSTQRRFTTPARAPGFYSLAVVDRYGIRAEGPDFEVKAAPVVDSVSVLAGPTRNGAIGIGGGAVLRIDGANFASDDTVTVGGATASVASRTATRVDVNVGSVAPGSLDVVVTDALGDSAGIQDAVTAVGLDDVTSSRSPRSNGVDALGANTAAVADLDRDGKADDLVLVGPTGGSRAMRTRQLRGNSSGALVDVTGTTMPSTAADPLGSAFDGGAIAIGDLDGTNGPDIVVADAPLYNQSTYYYYDPVRVLTNDGSGNFSYSYYTPYPSYFFYRPYLYVQDDYDYGWYVGFVLAPPADASTTALAIGDLDRDGDQDVVATSGSGAIAVFYVDPAYIDFTQTPYYATYYDLFAYPAYYIYILSATRILDNDGVLVDRTMARLGAPPVVFSTAPSYQGRDLALGDVDGTNGPDIVVTWDDPLTASVYGAYTAQYYGTSYDSPRVSTRLLLNDGSGRFTDRTDQWLPTGAGNEFWQGDAVELADVVGGSLPDLLILHDTGPSPSSSALRVLRNDGPSTGFTDVTGSVLPAPTATDNLGGTSLLVKDVDGDGRLDIVIGTTRSISDGQGGRALSTRVLFGTASGTFVRGDGFQEAPSVDSGETRFLLVGDMEGSTTTTLIVGGTSPPASRSDGERLRVFDWDE